MKSISKIWTVLTLMLLLTSMLFSMTIVNAQTSGLKTYAFVGATPNPVGVGQQTVFRLGITQQLAAPAYGWEGLTITVTHPDGEKETLGPYRTDSTGGTYALYIPTEVGNYTLQSHFPQQASPAAMGSIPKGQIMLSSDSDETKLEVLSEPIQAPQIVPLPTEYWYRPINDQYQSWQTIGGNWLPASNTAPTYNRVAYGNDYAPKSPHLLWSRPITAGGLIGGAQSGIQGDITNQ
jgi:hypothetical protein